MAFFHSHHMWIDCWSVIGSHFVVSGSTLKCPNNRRVSVKRDWVETTSGKIRTDRTQNTKTLGFSWWRNPQRWPSADHSWTNIKGSLWIVWDPRFVKFNQLS